MRKQNYKAAGYWERRQALNVLCPSRGKKVWHYFQAFLHMILLKSLLLQTSRWRGKQVNLENASVLLRPEGRSRWHCCCFVLNFMNFNSIPESFSRCCYCKGPFGELKPSQTTLSAERARSGVIAVHTKWRMLMSDNLTAEIRLYLTPFCFSLFDPPHLLPMPVAKLVLFESHRQSYSVLTLQKHVTAILFLLSEGKQK